MQHLGLRSQSSTDQSQLSTDQWAATSNGFMVDVRYLHFTMHDEGDLFVGSRSLLDEEQVKTVLANALNRRVAPS